MELQTQEKEETSTQDFLLGLFLVAIHAFYFLAWFKWPWEMLALHIGVLVFVVIPLMILALIIDAIRG